MQCTSKCCTLHDRVFLVSGYTLCSCGQLSQSTPVAEFLPSGHFRPGLSPRPSSPLTRAPIRGGCGNETMSVGNLRVRWQHFERFKAFASLRLLSPCSFAHLADRQASNSLLRTRIVLQALSLQQLQVRECSNGCGLTIYTSSRKCAMALAIKVCIDQAL